MKNRTEKDGVILLVDDQPETIDIIKAALEKYYVVKAVTKGKLVGEVVRKGHVDLILLDILMPEMSGYDVCRQLKKDPVTRNIPIIFLTSKDEDDDEALGLKLGAVDFIRKPTSPSIVLARSRNTIALYRAREDLFRKNIELQQTLTIREDMERLSHHDLKGPLNVILGVPQMIGENTNLTKEQKNS